MHFRDFDAGYVRRLTEGDSSVEQHFVAYFGELLRMKLRGRVRSWDRIQDIEQETLKRVLEALRRKDSLQHPERLGAFVNAVCNNVLKESFRQDARQTPIEDTQDWPDNRMDLDARLIDRERKALTERILAGLPARDQELLRVVFLEEAGKGEACRRLGVSQDYLRVLLHRAIGRARNKLPAP